MLSQLCRYSSGFFATLCGWALLVAVVTRSDQARASDPTDSCDCNTVKFTCPSNSVGCYDTNICSNCGCADTYDPYVFVCVS